MVLSYVYTSIYFSNFSFHRPTPGVVEKRRMIYHTLGFTSTYDISYTYTIVCKHMLLPAEITSHSLSTIPKIGIGTNLMVSCKILVAKGSHI